MSLNRSQRLGWVLALAGVLLAGGPLAAQTAPAGAAPRELSLEQALGVAAGTSESVSLARAGVTTAEGQQISARAERLPQISSSLSYSRTLINQFSGAGGAPTGDSTSQVVPCSSFATDPSRPLEERVSLLEQTVGCSTASPGGGLDL
ncbi:MAG TPA: hypothetical protein VHG51_00565, partial [Longimicrobiaceae bacterium]|nr:hypothetical protein [Longimicrobiaceae bacterium]